MNPMSKESWEPFLKMKVKPAPSGIGSASVSKYSFGNPHPQGDDNLHNMPRLYTGGEAAKYLLNYTF